MALSLRKLCPISDRRIAKNVSTFQHFNHKIALELYSPYALSDLMLIFGAYDDLGRISGFDLYFFST